MQKTSRYGQAEASASFTRRTETVTRVPILRSFWRIEQTLADERLQAVLDQLGRPRVDEAGREPSRGRSPCLPAPAAAHPHPRSWPRHRSKPQPERPSTVPKSNESWLQSVGIGDHLRLA